RAAQVRCAHLASGGVGVLVSTSHFPPFSTRVPFVYSHRASRNYFVTAPAPSGSLAYFVPIITVYPVRHGSTFVPSCSFMSTESVIPSPSESSEQDRLLVERALNGKEAAFQELVEKYRKALHHHISRMVRDKQEVEDLVQETFIKAFSALDSYASQYAFSTWLYKIATNHAIDFMRKK